MCVSAGRIVGGLKSLMGWRGESECIGEVTRVCDTVPIPLRYNALAEASEMLLCCIPCGESSIVVISLRAAPGDVILLKPRDIDGECIILLLGDRLKVGEHVVDAWLQSAAAGEERPCDVSSAENFVEAVLICELLTDNCAFIESVLVSSLSGRLSKLTSDAPSKFCSEFPLRSSVPKEMFPASAEKSLCSWSRVWQ